MERRTLRLIIRTENGVGHERTLAAGVPFYIGRGSDAGLRLNYRSVSRQHCCFELDEDGVLELIDLGSQNGTRLNGRRVERALLRSGDELLVATVPLRIEIPAAPAPAQHEEAASLSPAETRLRLELEAMGLEVIERVDLGSPIPVYRANRLDLEQEVIVKALPVGDDEQERERAARLLREARLAAKMRHRNTMQIHDVRQAAGLVAIIYEAVRGRTLARVIADAGRLDPSRAAIVGIEVCRALEHAHGLGIVHRNITPTTVMISAEGEVKVVGFGLAKSLLPGAGGPELTRQGQSLGAVEYAPPEQVRDASAVDHRADIYAVGSTLYHALAGEPPLIAVNPLAPDDLSADVPAPLGEVAPDVPEAVRAVVERAMRADPAERYQSAELMRLALESALALMDSATTVFLKADTAEIEIGGLAAAGPSGSGTTGFLGRLQAGEVIELLQMVEHNRKSGFLEICGTQDESSRRVSGSVVFRDGSIIDARSGEHRGIDALFDLLLIPSGNFRVIYGEPAAAAGETPLNISATILELLRRKDETARQPR